MPKIYILINPSMPGMVKVGRTRNSTNERANQISSATGVPTPFSVFAEFEVKDEIAAEKLAHEILESQYGRINKNREFFQCSPEVARQLLSSIFKGSIERRGNLKAFDLLNECSFTFSSISFEDYLLNAGALAASAIRHIYAGYLAASALSGRPILPCTEILDDSEERKKLILEFIAIMENFDGDYRGQSKLSAAEIRVSQMEKTAKEIGAKTLKFSKKAPSPNINRNARFINSLDNTNEPPRDYVPVSRTC